MIAAFTQVERPVAQEVRMQSLLNVRFSIVGVALVVVGASTVAQKDADLPKDVYADSRNRLPTIKVEELDDFGKKIYMAEAAGKTGADSGPRTIRIYSPKVAQYMTMGNSYLRWESGLDGKLREIAILLAARAMDQQYEWTAHEKAAIKEGLPQHVIDIIKKGTPIVGVADEKQAILIKLGRETLYDHKVGSDTFAQALKLFGRKGLVDVVSLMGHYTSTAILLTVFDQHLRSGDAPLLDPVNGGRPQTE
jgi:4-carboxymuconolactone decarboxylase